MSVYNSYTTSYCIAHIDLKALEHNYTTLLSRLPKGSQGMAILKNDAYGHGLLPAAGTLKNVQVTSFGVGTVSEGKALREAGFTEDILILLGAQSAEEMQLCAELSLMPAIYNQRALQWAAVHNNSHKTFKIAIKFETGMSRFGFTQENLPHVLDFLIKLDNLEVALAFSHLGTADIPENEAMVHKQAKEFFAMSNMLSHHYPNMQRSLCNSAASLAYADLSASLGAHIYRFGIALYGANPFMFNAWEEKGNGLCESMSVSTVVLHTFTVKAGQSVGYGATYIAPKDMRMAAVGIGYADGFSRALSTKNPPFTLCIHGQAAPICGRVCMGVIMVDISHIPNVEEGQNAWIINNTYGEKFSVSKLAQSWGTIAHECYCLLGKNSREYV